MSFEEPETDLQTLWKSIADAFGWVDADSEPISETIDSPKDKIKDISWDIAKAIKTYVNEKT